MAKNEPKKLNLGTYEVTKVEKKKTETEDGETLSWKYTLENAAEEIKLTISTKHELESLPVQTKGLGVTVAPTQSKLEV